MLRIIISAIKYATLFIDNIASKIYRLNYVR